MDLEEYSLEDMLLAAIKSEVESREIYLSLAERVNSGFLADRLKFIAEEEKKHRDYLESVYRMNLEKDPVLPDISPVPLPGIKVAGRYVPPSDILFQAMQAEKAAADFYQVLAGRFKNTETGSMLEYLSRMEMGHYSLLELEKQQLDREEEYEIEWEMMHVGP